MTALREVPLPPPELRIRVAGTDNAEWFEKSGRMHVERFAQALAQIGKRFEDFDDIYDFGCGPGRILRHLNKSAPHARLSGSDIDEPAIEWVRRHMSDVNAQANGWLPPLPFPAGGFDLVLGFSVFTHLSEEFQDAWLRELRRVTRPGAIALLTVHGERSWQWHSTESALADVDGIEDVGRQRQAHGFSHCRAGVQPGFPDFYGTTFHVPAYIHRHWSRWFEVVRVIEATAGSDHDVVVLRRPGPAGTALHALRRLPRYVHGRLRPERLRRSTHLSDTEPTDRAAHPRCFLRIVKSAGSSVRCALTAALRAGSMAPPAM
ncbi:MAG: class I SAM-dependent methyltransferase [Actinomycetota bacterium]|nr:class I SAM-dependent methyltransferase [Actinomycetota bacterium]